MEFARVNMPDGSQYDVPFQVIKEKLADRYAVRRADELVPSRLDNFLEWDNERKFANEDELMALNDLDKDEVLKQASEKLSWKLDLEPFAIRSKKPNKVDLFEGWAKGEKVIIEK
jgi:hypothetical protein